jgi:hypothetical protein
VDGIGAHEQRCLRIARALGDVAAVGASLGHSGASEDAIDGPDLGRVEPQLLHLPRDRGGTHLRPGISHQPWPDLKHDALGVLGDPPSLGLWGAGALLGPALIPGVIARHALSDPPVGAPEIGRHLGRGLARQYPRHRLLARFFLAVAHPLLLCL